MRVPSQHDQVRCEVKARLAQRPLRPLVADEPAAGVRGGLLAGGGQVGHTAGRQHGHRPARGRWDGLHDGPVRPVQPWDVVEPAQQLHAGRQAVGTDQQALDPVPPATAHVHGGGSQRRPERAAVAPPEGRGNEDRLAGLPQLLLERGPAQAAEIEAAGEGGHQLQAGTGIVCEQAGVELQAGFRASPLAHSQQHQLRDVTLEQQRDSAPPRPCLRRLPCQHPTPAYSLALSK